MQTDAIFDRLSRFCRANDCADFFAMAQENFWDDLIDLLGIDDLELIREVLGPQLWDLVQINLLAFFASNDYQQNPDPRAPRWNAVDCFLSRNAKKVTADEEHYLMALRQSHMSLYRIVGLEAEGGVKLWDMIDGKAVTVGADQELCVRLHPKETWGFRLVGRDEYRQIMQGALPLKASAAMAIASDMKKIHVKLMRHVKKPEVREEFGDATEAEIGHLARVMWAPEVATAFIAGEIARIGQAIMKTRPVP